MLFDATYTEELNRIVRDNKPLTKNIIKEMVDDYRKDVGELSTGERYYLGENDIESRVITTYQDGVKVIDIDAKNNKIPSGYHKLLVDQKVAYLAGKPVTVGSKSADEELLEGITGLLTDEFEDTVPELIKSASNKGREWLHPYINEDGAFDYIRIPAQEVIPIYDESKQKNLKMAVRFYSVDGKIKVEVWDTERVTYYEIIDNEIFLDVTHDINPASHFQYGELGYGWQEVPFIEFINNEERVSDLKFYKAYIDAYDLLLSDTANTLDEMQSLLYVLKGYPGTDLAEFVNGLKRYKAVAVDEAGGVDTLKAEVPINTVDSVLDRYGKNIFHFGQGADVSMDKFGNAPSGVALRQLYQLLDMKASIMERKFTKALKHFSWFMVEYLNISEGKQYDYKDVTFTFNKSMLSNEAEQVQMARDSIGILSLETIIAQHPWSDDVKLELKRLAAEREAYELEPLEEGE